MQNIPNRRDRAVGNPASSAGSSFKLQYSLGSNYLYLSLNFIVLT